MDQISVVSYNARGLRNRLKRRSIFRHIRISYPKSVIIIQETHSRPEMERIWESEWAGKIHFSHGTESGQAGVAILVPRDLNLNTRELFVDEAGRIVCLGIAMDRQEILLVGVYAPALDNQVEKCSFLTELRDILLGCNTQRTILSGDFNIKLGNLDTDNTNFKVTRSCTKLTDLIAEFSLEDAWRSQHPGTRKYTWRRSNPLQQSRIDYTFISDVLLNNDVVKTKIDAGVLSDHSFVSIEVQLSAHIRGPGTWRFNNTLLDDTEFTSTVREEIRKAKQFTDEYLGIQSKGLHVELMLSKIRVIAIRRSKQVAFEIRRVENELYQTLNDLENKISNEPNVQNIIEHGKVRERLDEIKLNRGRLAIVRSQATFIEQGERSTKYFMRQLVRIDSLHTYTRI